VWQGQFALGYKSKNPENIGVFEVFYSKKMVGAEGVEPSTFWSRSVTRDPI